MQTRGFSLNLFDYFSLLRIPVNWCQHWFELLAFPPINVLAMIENVLGECDINLLNTFYDAGITTKFYAWPLLSTAFSEVTFLQYFFLNQLSRCKTRF